MAWIKNHKIFTTQYVPANHRHSTLTPLSSHHRQLSTKNPGSPSCPPTTLWKTLKTPALFGVGLYFGFMLFGEHIETKQESAYFEALRYMFQDKDKKKDAKDENIGG